MTIQDAAKEALAVQDAVNLSGVARSMAEVINEAIWPEARRLGEGTKFVNTSPIVTLFIDKLASLNGHKDSFDAYDIVSTMARGE